MKKKKSFENRRMRSCRRSSCFRRITPGLKIDEKKINVNKTRFKRNQTLFLRGWKNFRAIFLARLAKIEQFSAGNCGDRTVMQAFVIVSLAIFGIAAEK
jgi:hypothetical protein